LNRFSLLASAALLAAVPLSAQAPTASTPVAATSQSAALKQFFEDYDKAELALSPMRKSYRAIKDQDYGKLDDYTDAAAFEARELDQKTVDEMARRFDRASLSAEDQLSYDLLQYRNRRDASIFPYRRNLYVFDQMNGAQADIPAFLINIHKIENESQARDYISRIRASATYLDQAIAESKEREKVGNLPPKWVFPQVIEQSQNLIKGAPFDSGPDNDVFADFKTKVGKLGIPQPNKDALIADASKALTESMGPAYQRVIAALTDQQGRAGTADGIWRFKNGAAMYQALLGYYTTTDLTPDQVHELGLAQVARIHGEMEAIKNKVGFKGTLQQFFAQIGKERLGRALRAQVKKIESRRCHGPPGMTSPRRQRVSIAGPSGARGAERARRRHRDD